MQSPCEYELRLRDASKPAKGVFVIVERGWQVGNLYFDPDVVAFAERHDLALMLARHCRAKTEEDMDIIPEHGIGRALLQSLKNFGQAAHHPELAEASLILFSFSGGRSTVARMVAYAPERVLAAVEYAPGHREPIGIDTLTCRSPHWPCLNSLLRTALTTEVEPEGRMPMLKSIGSAHR